MKHFGINKYFDLNFGEGYPEDSKDKLWALVQVLACRLSIAITSIYTTSHGVTGPQWLQLYNILEYDS